MWSDKKPMILCTRSTSRSHARERECVKRLFASKIARVYEYQTWPTHSRGAQRFVAFFFLIVLFGCWLAVQANSDGQSRGFTTLQKVLSGGTGRATTENSHQVIFSRRLQNALLYDSEHLMLQMFSTIAPTICVIFVWSNSVRASMPDYCSNLFRSGEN